MVDLCATGARGVQEMADMLLWEGKLCGESLELQDINSSNPSFIYLHVNIYLMKKVVMLKSVKQNSHVPPYIPYYKLLINLFKLIIAPADSTIVSVWL